MHRDVIKAVLMSVVLIVLGTAITVAWRTKDMVLPQGYTVGQCLIFNEELEPWEEQWVWYIEMVGKRSYLVRKYPANVNKPSRGVTISFTSAALSYKQVECPPKS